VRVTVSAPARLHLGFIDLNGRCGRMFGSVGVAIERPRCVVEARAGEGAPDEPSGEVLDTLERLGPCDDRGSTLDVQVVESIPRHVGLGSGTQRRLAVALAVSLLGERPVRGAEMARVLGRGKRSGIGIATFDGGGFVVDAGHRTTRTTEALEEVPPVVIQHPVPADWYFVIVVPTGDEGLHGKREDEAFVTLPPISDASVGRISRLTLMKVIPGVLTDDIEAFGAGVTEIQELIGQHFAPVQGGVYATEIGARAAAFALSHGACGVGQSSWGPAVFALVRSEARAAALARAIEAAFLEEDRRPLVFHTRADNTGATWRREP
jgi:beta-ribofuranosylaminobenzene 5'-phosphate synthase